MKHPLSDGGFWMVGVLLKEERDRRSPGKVRIKPGRTPMSRVGFSDFPKISYLIENT